MLKEVDKAVATMKFTPMIGLDFKLLYKDLG
jgi:hypothetical protein